MALRLPDTTVIEDPDLLASLRRDESHVIGALPRALVRPRSADALKALVRLAQDEGLGLVVRGAGTGKAGGCVPMANTLVVDLCEWPGAITLNRADLSLSAPASASLKGVKDAAQHAGLFYPPDPNSWPLCGFGGSLATNAGGPNAGKYGMTRHWVLSVDALMADGGIHRFGIGTVKDNGGPALAQLFIGSEGIFGLILGATVRVIPAPRDFLTLLLPVARWEDLLDLPASLAEAGLQPSAFEFFDPAVLKELRAHGPEEARRLPGEALALIEFDDHGCTGELFIERLMAALGDAAGSIQLATDAGQRERLWAVRRMTSAFLKERHPQKVSEDITVPRSRIKDFFAGLERLGIPAVSYGHLGDGNLHVNLLAAGETAQEALATQLMGLFRLSVDLGGTLSGEHGIGLAKRDAFLALSDPYHVEMLRNLKRALDPHGLFNPGKVI